MSVFIRRHLVWNNDRATIPVTEITPPPNHMHFRDLIIPRLPHHTVNRGWYRFKCPVCNDYKVRAGFNFNDDFVIYNCWNCKTAPTHHEDWNRMASDMRTVLSHIGITDHEIDEVLGAKGIASLADLSTPKVVTISTTPKINYSVFTPPIIEFPPATFQVTAETAAINPWAYVAKEYLEKVRGIPITDYPFYVSMSPEWQGFVFIPFFRNGKLVFWQARNMDANNKLRYLSPELKDDQEKPIFGYDVLSNTRLNTVYWHEGALDAISVGQSCCLMGSSLSASKKELLRRSRKRHVFVVDKDWNGIDLAEDVLNEGYSITHSDDGYGDANATYRTIGRLPTLDMLYRNTKQGLAATLWLEMLKTQLPPKKQRP